MPSELLTSVLVPDAAGNSSSTNLSVVKSSVTLTILSTPEGESLAAGCGTVFGTVCDPSYSVSVNGVTATVDEYGNWVAENVPVYGRGTATFDAVATASGGGGGLPVVTASVEKEKPAYIAVVQHSTSQSISADDGLGHSSSYERTKVYNAQVQPGPDGDWLLSFDGTATHLSQDNYGWSRWVYHWTATNQTAHWTDSQNNSGSWTNIEESYAQITGVPDKDLTELGWLGGSGGVGGYPPTFIYHYYAGVCGMNGPMGTGGGKRRRWGRGRR